jgi:hypothetical protein
MPGNRPGAFVRTVEGDRWHKMAEQLECCVHMEDENAEVRNYKRWGYKNNYFNLIPAGKDNTTLSALRVVV